MWIIIVFELDGGINDTIGVFDTERAAQAYMDEHGYNERLCEKRELSAKE